MSLSVYVDCMCISLLSDHLPRFFSFMFPTNCCLRGKRETTAGTANPDQARSWALILQLGSKFILEWSFDCETLQSQAKRTPPQTMLMSVRTVVHVGSHAQHEIIPRHACGRLGSDKSDHYVPCDAFVQAVRVASGCTLEGIFL